LFDVAADADEAIIDRIRGALGSVPLQVLVVTADGLDPDSQAMSYAAATHGDLGPEYAVAARTYRDHLRSLGIAATRHVLLDMHRPADGAPLFAAAVQARKIYDAAALAEMRVSLALAAQDASVLLAARVKPSSHAWLVQERCLGDLERTQCRVRFDGGRARDQELSDAAAALVQLLAECSTLSEAVVEYARICPAPPEAVESAVLDFVREALVSGLLVQAEA
jgi:hypothetical protein